MKLMLVTGASSGLGRAFAVHFSTKYKVIAIGRRENMLLETQNLGKSENIEICVADLNSDSGRNKILNLVKNLNLKVSFLIQNAGVLGQVTNIENISEIEWRKSFDTNLHSPLILFQSLLKQKMFEKSSRILHVSSGAAHKPLIGWPSYNASKSAFLMLFKYLSQEMFDKDIFVGSFKPGVVASEMQNEIRESSKEFFPTKDRFNEMHSKSCTLQKAHIPPKDGLDTPLNVAYFVDFLLDSNLVSDREFCNPADSKDGEWDIRDPSHHEKWID